MTCCERFNPLKSLIARSRAWAIGILLLLGIVPVRAGVEDQSATEEFSFRLPQPAAYRLTPSVPPSERGTPVSRPAFRSSTMVAPAAARSQWLKALPTSGSTNVVEFGSRVVVQVGPDADLARFISGRPLQLSRTVGSGVHILQAPDALTAMHEARRLAVLPGVTAAYPVVRQAAELHDKYAYQPTDSLFYLQWALEHRNRDFSSAGVDLNVRAAWPFSTGKGVTIAVADTGVELEHPELVDRTRGAPHYNFADQSANGGPIDGYLGGAHGTEVAGLAAASIGNARMVGVAPGASLASWVIFHTNFTLASDEELMDMYQCQSNVVAVQNHSWGHTGFGLGPITLLEEIGISNAITAGRSGKGVLMVRSAGNGRVSVINANSDGYFADPRVVAVAAVRLDGRVATYSEPGACVLVAAPSGDSDAGFDGLFTTDLLGTRGVNQINYFPPYQDLSGYVFNSLGFSGTSAAVPQISGLIALLLAANPALTYRDVQQILVLSSRHFDPADPVLGTNGAGLQVSHNVGFGVPDAGAAVALARGWTSRPPARRVTVSSDEPAALTDAGLRVLVTDADGATLLAAMPALSGAGLHPDTPTANLPVVDLGFGTNDTELNLTNKAVLIQRDAATFTPKITKAAQSGAAFAIVCNFATNSLGYGPPGGDYLVVMATDFAPIPAVFVGYNGGEAIKSLVQTNASALAQVRLASTSYSFNVTDTLICEHVGLRVKTDHQRRGDLRITLVSPSGTRSVLQQYGFDSAPGPVDWTYYSTHHFFEGSAGTWTAYFSDEAPGSTGSILHVSLMLDGVPITDADRDGLDDGWERAFFGGLQTGPKDDPDHDGCSNAREQIMGTDPTSANDVPFSVDLSRWNDSTARLSWPGSPAHRYEVWGGADVRSLSLITNVSGRFPETEWFMPCGAPPYSFFRVRAVPAP